jgi:hypothetical protein
MDDIWISGHLDRRGVKKYAVPGSARLRTVRQQAGTMRLDVFVVARPSFRHETAAFFRDTWSVFSWPFGLDYRLRALLRVWPKTGRAPRKTVS